MSDITSISNSKDPNFFFINVNGKEERFKYSENLYNQKELEMIYYIIKYIERFNLKIAIGCLYKHQKKLLVKRFKKKSLSFPIFDFEFLRYEKQNNNNNNNDHVSNIYVKGKDEMCLQDYDLIIISLVHNNEEGYIGPATSHHFNMLLDYIQTEYNDKFLMLGHLETFLKSSGRISILLKDLLVNYNNQIVRYEFNLRRSIMSACPDLRSNHEIISDLEIQQLNYWLNRQLNINVGYVDIVDEVELDQVNICDNILLVNINGKDEKSIDDYINSSEIRSIINVILYVQYFYPEKKISVVTFSFSQYVLLKEMVENQVKNYNEVNIYYIEYYNGNSSETDIILISTVRSNNHYEINPTLQLKENVDQILCKNNESVIIFGNINTLRKSKDVENKPFYIRSVVTFLQKRNKVIHLVSKLNSFIEYFIPILDNPPNFVLNELSIEYKKFEDFLSNDRLKLNIQETGPDNDDNIKHLNYRQCFDDINPACTTPSPSSGESNIIINHHLTNFISPSSDSGDSDDNEVLIERSKHVFTFNEIEVSSKSENTRSPYIKDPNERNTPTIRKTVMSVNQQENQTPPSVMDSEYKPFYDSPFVLNDLQQKDQTTTDQEEPFQVLNHLNIQVNNLFSPSSDFLTRKSPSFLNMKENIQNVHHQNLFDHDVDLHYNLFESKTERANDKNNLPLQNIFNPSSFKVSSSSSSRYMYESPSSPRLILNNINPVSPNYENKGFNQSSDFLSSYNNSNSDYNNGRNQLEHQQNSFYHDRNYTQNEFNPHIYYNNMNYGTQNISQPRTNPGENLRVNFESCFFIDILGKEYDTFYSGYFNEKEIIFVEGMVNYFTKYYSNLSIGIVTFYDEQSKKMREYLGLNHGNNHNISFLSMDTINNEVKYDIMLISCVRCNPQWTISEYLQSVNHLNVILNHANYSTFIIGNYLTLYNALNRRGVLSKFLKKLYNRKLLIRNSKKIRMGIDYVIQNYDSFNREILNYENDEFHHVRNFIERRIKTNNNIISENNGSIDDIRNNLRINSKEFQYLSNVLFVNVNGKEKVDNTTGYLSNPHETEKVFNTLIYHVYTYPHLSIGVLTYSRKQAIVLQRKVVKRGIHGVRVQYIGEWHTSFKPDVMLVSFVKSSNQPRGSDSVVSILNLRENMYKILNCARRKIILFGNYATLYNLTYFHHPNRIKVLLDGLRKLDQLILNGAEINTVMVYKCPGLTSNPNYHPDIIPREWEVFQKFLSKSSL